jgi:uncharacterized cupredoxin-like copper-binding protein
MARFGPITQLGFCGLLASILFTQPALAQIGELKTFLEGATSEKIELELKDFAFAPDRLVLKRGKTYRLELMNTGPVLHYFGSKDFQAMIEVLGVVSDGVMRPPTNQHHFPVNPGSAKTLVIRPKVAGEIPLTCFIPTHVLYGMTGTIEIVD